MASISKEPVGSVPDPHESIGPIISLLNLAFRLDARSLKDPDSIPLTLIDIIHEASKTPKVTPEVMVIDNPEMCTVAWLHVLNKINPKNFFTAFQELLYGEPDENSTSVTMEERAFHVMRKRPQGALTRLVARGVSRHFFNQVADSNAAASLKEMYIKYGIPDDLVEKLEEEINKRHRVLKREEVRQRLWGSLKL